MARIGHRLSQVDDKSKKHQMDYLLKQAQVVKEGTDGIAGGLAQVSSDLLPTINEALKREGGPQRVNVVTTEEPKPPKPKTAKGGTIDVTLGKEPKTPKTETANGGTIDVTLDED